MALHLLLIALTVAEGHIVCLLLAVGVLYEQVRVVLADLGVAGGASRRRSSTLVLLNSWRMKVGDIRCLVLRK